MLTALIFGITGQDGSYLAEILLEKGYEVHGVHRRTSTGNLENIKHLVEPISRLTLHHGDLADATSIYRIIDEVRPTEIYNEADQDNVGWSHDTPAYSAAITYGAVATMLEVIRTRDWSIKFFQPVSATMFGQETFCQNEHTPLDPGSPYACAKAGAYHLVRHYRRKYDVFASTGILYNHDSPRRSEEYLMHKICKSALRISQGHQDHIALGNLDLHVDIGYAREFMENAWRLMELDYPDDFVLATGQGYTIRYLAEMALFHLDVDLAGKVVVNPEYDRKDSPTLIGCIDKAKGAFGFEPKYHGSKLIGLLLQS
jgi:GDPmannose 4,6-dehydratase